MAVTPVYIDVDLVEAILQENNDLEIQWLHNLLESGIKVMGNHGRYLSAQRFIDKISPTLGERQDSGQ